MKNKIVLNCIKRMALLGIVGFTIQIHAEVLVILPETGPMSRAGLSIKQGILSAYQVGNNNIPLKFVNSEQKSLKLILKQNVNKKTQMIIGPLARPDVEALIKLKPKVPVLALNEVYPTHKNVWQYSLSKNDDALALLDYIHHDKVSKLYVVREKGAEAESINFLNALFMNYRGEVDPVDEMPKVRANNEGVLLLGSNEWLTSLKKLQKKNIYTQAIAVNEKKALPKGMKFCDVPALYIAEWSDVIQAYKEKPTSLPYQRLYAFGGDAWHIAEHFVLNPKAKNLTFSGRTGKIKIEANRVERIPQCFERSKSNLVAL
ncbi:penicillin-binding protein activator [Acinetobacter piscicola]|uniref:penicillin-binding protein activator n=1 Tax=Acinetobacter piscicola TaxID=2006115 RepID=UPI000B7F3157|nr:penicillin-binding protein activator [Acinetobacter piscicola]